MSNKSEISSRSSSSRSPFASDDYLDLPSRLNDNKKLIEQVILSLFKHLKRRGKTSSDRVQCVTIPKRELGDLDPSPTANVWCWPDLQDGPNRFIHRRLQTKATTSCLACQRRQICLNPNHYDTEDTPGARPLPDSNPPWATIAYHELGSRVGEPFRSNSSSIHVDAYKNPCMKTFPHRFLLDELANPDRSLDVINVRQQIGGGVRLHRVGGQLFAECKSEAAIFVHSRYYNRTRGYDPAKICRMHMSRGRLMTLFEDDQFDKWLADAEGYESVRQLAKMCTIRISFVRGWGKWNKENPLLTNVPCWIEIKLQRPLDKIHETVQQMRTLHKMYC